MSSLPSARHGAITHRALRGPIVSVVLLGIAALPASADGQQCLQSLEAQIAQQYPSVPSILPDELAAKLGTADAPLLIDVREASEQQVSTLPGAISISPSMSPEAFVRAFAAVARGREVVLYCSVGVRSSRFARLVRDRMMRSGAHGVRNLRGGVFAWHNTGRALTAHQGSTEFVHPYSSRWATYIDFTNYTRYAPDY